MITEEKLKAWDHEARSAPWDVPCQGCNRAGSRIMELVREVRQLRERLGDPMPCGCRRDVRTRLVIGWCAEGERLKAELMKHVESGEIVTGSMAWINYHAHYEGSP